MSDRSLPQLAPAADDALALACSLPASDQRERAATIHDLASRATRRNALPTGVELHFDSADDTARLVCDVVLAERDCCAQFAYTISFEPRRGTLALRVEADASFAAALHDLYLGASPSTDSRDDHSIE